MAETRGARNMHLQFACTAYCGQHQGECDREFFCINPNFSRDSIGLLSSHFGSVCPHLIAWDPFAKSQRDLEKGGKK